jgi:hypothetical protein
MRQKLASLMLYDMKRRQNGRAFVETFLRCLWFVYIIDGQLSYMLRLKTSRSTRWILRTGCLGFFLMIMDNGVANQSDSC